MSQLLKLEIKFYQFDCCLRSEERVYKAEIVIHRTALPYKELYKSLI
jgi:hypothetical protein